MAILRSQIEQSDVTQYIPPKGDYQTFRDEDHFKEKLKEWDYRLLNESFGTKSASFSVK